MTFLKYYFENAIRGLIKSSFPSFMKYHYYFCGIYWFETSLFYQNFAIYHFKE